MCAGRSPRRSLAAGSVLAASLSALSACSGSRSAGGAPAQTPEAPHPDEPVNPDEPSALSDATRRRGSPEDLEARMARIADDTVERMIGREAVPQLSYDAELEAQRAAHPNARFEGVVIGSSGLKLEAWMVKPSEDVPFRGTVLVLHPWQSNRAFALKQFGFLLEHGYQLFIPDARSNLFIGNPDAFNSYLKEDLRDLEQVMAHLKSRPDVGPLAVYGCAWGGLKAILLASAEPRIRAAVSDAGTLHYGLILVDFMNKMPPHARNDWDLVSRFLEKVRTKLEARMGYDIDQYDPRDAISEISPRPVMLIHGEDDTFVPIEVSEEMYAAAEQPKTFLRGESFGHCNGMHEAPGRYIPGVVVFLERSLPQPPRRRGR